MVISVGIVNLKNGIKNIEKNQMYLPDIKKEFKLNKEEIEVVKEFYDTRGMLGIEDEAVNNSNNIVKRLASFIFLLDFLKA